MYNVNMKIWVKLMQDGKIKQQTVYERPGQMVYSSFFEYLSEICTSLDVPTPVLLKTHIFNYAKFNQVRFNKTDFVEEFSFDSLVLENLF